MASDKSRYYHSFDSEMSASNVGQSVEMDSSFGHEQSWTTDASVESYTGFDQQQLSAPSFQTSIMSGNGIAEYAAQPLVQQPARKQFHHRQPQPKKQPAQPQLLYCEICRISCAGPQPYADHLNGQKHKKKDAAQALQQKLEQFPKAVKSGATSRLYCELCDVACGSADAYASHVRGVKHMRVLNLHTTMGRPVPTITIPPTTQTSTAVPTLASAPASSAPASSATASATIPTPGKKPSEEKTSISSAGGDSKDDASDKTGTESAMDTSELLGQEFIEEVRNEKGMVVSYNCKLCECSFTDPNARRVHLKGRRHRFQYKKKIDSTIEVDVKVSARTQKIRDERNRKQMSKESYWKQQDHILGMRMEMNQAEFHIWNQPRYAMGPRYNTLDDRYMINKHMELYPPKEEMSEIHNSIMLFENALKLVSDVIAAEDEPAKKLNPTDTSEVTMKNVESEEKTGVAEKMDTEKSEKTEKESTKMAATEAADCEASRRIKGAMRVGLLSKGVLLRDDLVEHLVVICSEKPTRSLLQRIVDHLPAQLEVVAPLKKFNIETRFKESGLFVTIDKPAASFAVTLTSMLISEDQPEEMNPPTDDDQLSPTQCLSALAFLRHTKWFQVRLCTMKSGIVVTHVLRDFCRRNPIWTPLSEWAQELLVEKGIFAAGIDIGPGEALRSFFECVSSGILLPGGHGLMDPCEKVPTDVTANLTPQQSEDITASAQQFLRLIVYRQMYKVLNVEQLKRTTFKRRRDYNDDKTGREPGDKKLKEDVALQGSGDAGDDPPLTSVDKNAIEESL